MEKIESREMRKFVTYEILWNSCDGYILVLEMADFKKFSIRRALTRWHFYSKLYSQNMDLNAPNVRLTNRS